MEPGVELHMRAVHFALASFHRDDLSRHARAATAAHGRGMLVYKCPLLGEPLGEEADGEYVPASLIPLRWPPPICLRKALENYDAQTHCVFVREYVEPECVRLLVDVLRLY